MARKVKKIRTSTEAGRTLTADPLELNRWCVEMAMRWPVHEDHIGYGQAMGGMSQFPKTVSRTDADVIGRAAKIFVWVSAERRP